MADERLHFGPCSEKQRLVLQDNETDLLITGGGAGSGKALRHGEKVITPLGSVNIEDVQVGDIISSVNGGFQKVTAKYPQGLVDIYRVKFQDGRSVDVCKDHLWSFHRAGKGPGRKRVENTLKLKQIVEDSCKGGRKYLPIVQLTSPVEFQTSWHKLPLDPYVLGVILGDGYISADGYATIVSADQEIVDRISSSGVHVGNPTSKTGTHAKAYRLTGMGQPLRDLGLAGAKSASKFIPAQYKVSSVEDRYAILQGLMDTDGYASEAGETVYYSVSETLAKDVQEIAWSLGYSAKITSKIGKYRDGSGSIVNCQRVYSVYIRGENQKRLFHLKRKASRCKDKFVGLRVEAVEYVGKDFATCISVSDESSLFLTTNCVVTHNSRTCLTKALAFINDPAARVLIVRLSYPLLKLPGGLVDESKKIYPHFGGVLMKQTLEWIFPNGAKITFKAKPDDIQEWQGLQATNILVDEIAEFTEEDILFMQGRIRGADYKGHMGLIGTCNPSRDSFLYKWVEYSLDPATGIPMPGTEHRRRFFINKDNKIIWADSREELVDIVRDKYGEEAASKCKPLSFRYIPMTIYDNPILMKNNPGYLANLEGQSRVNQQRYIHG